jgi:hypothetical protein
MINSCLNLLITTWRLWCITIFQFYRGGQFYWLRKLEYPEKTTDLSEVQLPQIMTTKAPLLHKSWILFWSQLYKCVGLQYLLYEIGHYSILHEYWISIFFCPWIYTQSCSCFYLLCTWTCLDQHIFIKWFF